MKIIPSESSAGFQNSDFAPPQQDEMTAYEKDLRDRLARIEYARANRHPGYDMPMDQLREFAFYPSHKKGLVEMQRAANVPLLTFVASRPWLPTSPAVNAEFVQWVEENNIGEISISTAEKFYNQLMASGRYTADYSQAAKDRRHADIESWRAQGFDLPQHVEKSMADMTQDEMKAVVRVAPPVPLAPLKDLHNKVSEFEQKYGEKPASRPKPEPKFKYVGERVDYIRSKVKR